MFPPKRIIVGLTMIAIPYACSIPDERHSRTEADGGTSSVVKGHLGGTAVAQAAGADGGRYTYSGSVPSSAGTGGEPNQSKAGSAGLGLQGEAGVWPQRAGGTSQTSAAAIGGSVGLAGSRTFDSAGASMGGAAGDRNLTAGAGMATTATNRLCGSRDCLSALDNDCNDKADNTECPECNQVSPRACETHPGYDGIGACHAGHQELIRSPSGCRWSECADSQGPTSEACGPDKTDVNCNGVQGDGDWQPACVSRVTLCTSSDSHRSVSSVTDCPASQIQSNLIVFASAGPDESLTRLLSSCTVVDTTGTYSSPTKCGNLVRVGSCTNTKEEGNVPLGYVAYSVTPIKNYRRLAYQKTEGLCGTTSTGHPLVLADECSDCTLTDYYVLPQPKPE